MQRDRVAINKLLEDLSQQTDYELDKLYEDYYKNDDGVY